MPEFWEYLDRRGQRVFTAWRERLKPAERARVDDKMRAVETFGTTAPCLKPVTGFPHLRKIRIFVPDQNLRPLLCLGPFDLHSEFTLLIGAREQDFDWDPANAREEAMTRREEIRKDRNRRVRYEVPKP